MGFDRYAGTAERWAAGAILVYRPITKELLSASPHPLVDRMVLDIGTGTGVATALLAAMGARPVGADLSLHMLQWRAPQRPPGVVADVHALPFAESSVDDSFAAFVLNHLTAPGAGLAEMIRVTRPGGAVLACVFANASRNEVRDALDATARLEGWEAPAWYVAMKEQAIPLLGTAEAMAEAAAAQGLDDVVVAERAVDVGVTEPEQLVEYRLGQAQFSDWLDAVGPARSTNVKARLVEAIRPVMRPYEPIVVFLSGTVPAATRRLSRARRARPPPR